jgi:hypothetical protein
MVKASLPERESASRTGCRDTASITSQQPIRSNVHNPSPPGAGADPRSDDSDVLARLTSGRRMLRRPGRWETRRRFV